MLPVVLGVMPSSALSAVNNTYIKQLQNQAEQKQLWQQQAWLNLLHYRKSKYSKPQFNSSVDDGSFFLASTGKVNPQLELKATLASFFEIAKNDNEQSLCRFVARYHWLSSQLDIKHNLLPRVECTEYKEWRKIVKSGKLSLIFPAYHLNSPSSMFGHTLLRLDPENDDDWSDWLSFAVNFGANINNSDNSMAYAYKGLTGGYPGQFIVAPYYKKILEYSRIEKRDIWEYELNLLPEEVEKLVEHLWELKEVNFDYFFFTENCSYRLLELLEVARPGVELTNEFILTAIPVDTVRAIERSGMIASVDYLPSREAVLQSMISSLSKNELAFLDELLQSPEFVSNEAFSSLPDNRQRFIAETAYKLLRLQQNKQARNKAIAKKSYQLLSIINQYDVGVEQHIERPVQPEKSHRSQQLSLKVGERNNADYAELGFRMSFHSLEDNDLGFLRGAQINIANIAFRYSDEDSFFLQRLDLADIFSLTPRTEFFKPFSWRVRGGLERVYRDGRDRLVAHISGGGGSAWNLTVNSMAYTLLTTRVEANNEFEGYIEPALGVAAGLLVHNDIGTGKFELTAEKFSGGHDSKQLEYEQNLIVSKNHAIRLSFKREWYRHNQFSEVSLAYKLHF